MKNLKMKKDFLELYNATTKIRNQFLELKQVLILFKCNWENTANIL